MPAPCASRKFRRKHLTDCWSPAYLWASEALLMYASLWKTNLHISNHFLCYATVIRDVDVTFVHGYVFTCKLPLWRQVRTGNYFFAHWRWQYASVFSCFIFHDQSPVMILDGDTIFQRVVWFFACSVTWDGLGMSVVHPHFCKGKTRRWWSYYDSDLSISEEGFCYFQVRIMGNYLTIWVPEGAGVKCFCWRI